MKVACSGNFLSFTQFFSSISRLRDTGAALLVFTASTIARPDLVTVIYSYKHGGNTVTCYLLECFRAASLIYWRVVNSVLGCCRDIQNRLKCVSVCFCVEVLTKSHSAGLTECRVTLPTSTSVLRLSDKSWWFLLSVYFSRQKETELQYREGRILHQTSLP